MRAGRLFNKAVTNFAACMEPVIPLLLSGGLLKLALLILDTAHILPYGGSTAQLLRIISDVPFYFLPLFVAYSSAKHFKTEPMYAIAATAVMLTPEFIEIMQSQAEVSFLTLPVIKASYSSTVFPPILITYLMSLILRALEKHIGRGGAAVMIPLLTLLFASLLGIIIIGPAGMAASGLLSDGMERLYGMQPAAACAALGFLIPLLVTVGLHWVFLTVAIVQLSTVGVEPFLFACCFNLNMSLGGAMLAVYLKSKRPGLKKTAFSAGLTTVTTGVSEASLFGVCVPEKTPLAACMLACGLAGAYQGLMSVKCYVYSFPGIFSVLMFLGPNDTANLLRALASGAIALCAAFLLTWTFYKDRPALK